MTPVSLYRKEKNRIRIKFNGQSITKGIYLQFDVIDDFDSFFKPSINLNEKN